MKEESKKAFSFGQNNNSVKEAGRQTDSSSSQTTMARPTNAATILNKTIDVSPATSCNPITGLGMISKKDLFFADFAKDTKPTAKFTDGNKIQKKIAKEDN